MSPYTKDDSKNPRAAQIAKPKNIGEFTLSVTAACLRYIENVGESFQHYTHVAHALSNRNLSIGDTEFAEPKNLSQLCKHINFLKETYKGRVRMTSYNEEINGALILATAELQNRMISLYETQKCLENGDIFTKDQPLLVLGGRVVKLEDRVAELEDK